MPDQYSAKELRKIYNAVQEFGSCEGAARMLNRAPSGIRALYARACATLKLPDARTSRGGSRQPPPADLATAAAQRGGAQEQARVVKEYKRIIAERTEEERILRLFDRTIRAFPALPANHFKARTRPQKSTGRHVETPVLLRSDQQIGEEISRTETHGINHYDFQTFQSRLEQLENRVLDILTDHQRADFPAIVVPYLGDNISGRIHIELQKYGHQHVIDQVYLGAIAEALFLYRLLKFGRWDQIVVPCLSGNHGRLDKEKESKQYYKNFDYLFVSIMATLLRNVPQIVFQIPQALFTVIDIADHRVLLSHGHELPPSSLGIPLYSINRASAAYQELLSMSDSSRFQYWFMGHFHRPLELDGSFVNGTMAGLSEFGIGRFKPIRPMQRLMGFHKKWGRAWEYPVQLDQAPDAQVYTLTPAMSTPDALELFAEKTREADKASS